MKTIALGLAACLFATAALAEPTPVPQQAPAITPQQLQSQAAYWQAKYQAAQIQLAAANDQVNTLTIQVQVMQQQQRQAPPPAPAAAKPK